MTEPIVLRKLKPYYGRIAVVDTPVDEEQRESGLIVPLESESVTRGVIVNVDYIDDSEAEEYVRLRLKVGTPIYYQGGIKISDLTFIMSSDIIAYEED